MTRPRGAIPVCVDTFESWGGWDGGQHPGGGGGAGDLRWQTSKLCVSFDIPSAAQTCELRSNNWMQTLQVCHLDTGPP